MTHIFLVHSHICSLAVHSTVKKLLECGYKVIILENRAYEWPFMEKKIILKDITKYSFYNLYGIREIRSLYDICCMKKYQHKAEKLIKDIIDDENFIYYTPGYTMGLSSFFINNSKCKGYFYIEEGVLAYRSAEFLKQHYYDWRKNVIAKFLNLRYGFILSCTHKFKGTIAISEKAFPWNKKHKVVNGLNREEIKSYFKDEMYSDIVVFSHLNETISELEVTFSFLIKHFEQLNCQRFAIKFHPHSYIYDLEKINYILKLVSKCQGVDIIILPKEYIVEYAIVCYKACIYSINVISSLALYALIFGSQSFYIKLEEGKCHIRALTCLEKVL